VLPALSAEGKIPRAAVLLVSAVGLAVLYGVWYYRSSLQDTELPLIAEVPDRLVALSPPDGSTSAPAVPLEPLPTLVPQESAAPPLLPALPEAATVPEPVEQGAGIANAATPADAGDDGALPTVAAPDPPMAAAEAPPDVAAADPSATAAAVVSRTGDAAAPVTVAPAPEPVPPATTAAPAPVSPTPMSPETPPAPVAALAPPPATPATGAAEIPAAPALPALSEPAVQQAAVSPPGEPGVVLEARMDSWIEVVDASGKKVFSQILRAGERYVVPRQSGLVLATGNAGGLDVLVDGRKAPPLGGVGHVVKRIALEPARLLEGTAAAN
jgi:cytoskeleton protein RodZ